MSFIYVMIAVFLIIGFGLIIFAVFRKQDSGSSTNFLEVEAVVQLINSSIEEADNAVENLNHLSTDIFREFEEKYQEMLFLYQLIDEKKTEAMKVAEVGTKTAESVQHPERKRKATQKKPKNQPKAIAFDNSRLPEIRSLQEQGFSVSEIAKQLRMGQGEVKMIMELGDLG